MLFEFMAEQKFILVIKSLLILLIDQLKIVLNQFIVKSKYCKLWKNYAASCKISTFQLDNLVYLKKMLKNAYLLENIGADTAENGRNLAKKLATTYPSAPRVSRSEASLGGKARSDTAAG